MTLRQVLFLLIVTFAGRILGMPFAQISTPGRVLLVALFVFSSVLSILWWRYNPNAADILNVYPFWEYNGFVMYDGYGNYAQFIHTLLAHPGQEAWDNLQHYNEINIHSWRVLFPFLIAIVHLLGIGIVPAALAVNFAGILGAWYLFDRVCSKHWNFKGESLLHCHVLFLSHLGVSSTFGRPMPDTLLLLFLLGTFYFFCEWMTTKQLKYVVGIAAMICLGTLAKTVFILAIPAIALALVPLEKANLRESAGKFGLIGFASFVGALLLAFFLIRLAPDSAASGFLLDFLRGPLFLFDALTSDAGFLAVYVMSGALFLGIALQFHALSLPFVSPWKESRARIIWIWMSIYALQRFVFYGFNLDFSRARYGIPIAVGAVILSYSVFNEKLRPGTRRLAVGAMVTLNYVAWLVLMGIAFR